MKNIKLVHASEVPFVDLYKSEELAVELFSELEERRNSKKNSLVKRRERRAKTKSKFRTRVKRWESIWGKQGWWTKMPRPLTLEDRIGKRRVSLLKTQGVPWKGKDLDKKYILKWEAEVRKKDMKRNDIMEERELLEKEEYEEGFDYTPEELSEAFIRQAYIEYEEFLKEEEEERIRQLYNKE